MYDQIIEGKVWLSVLYNLGLVVLLSTTLGVLMSRITDMFKHENPPVKTTGRNIKEEKIK
jgi:hypothetical protein